MKAAVCRTLDGPSALSIEELPEPVPGDGELLVDVHACGVNFADTLIVSGRYQERPELPFVPGMEIAGEVLSGPLAAGTRILARCGTGGFAERAVVAGADVVAIPPAMSYVDAAAFAVAYGTAHVGLVHRAALTAGETVLVHGAGGGVGLAAVQVASQLGARVIATAGSAEKLELAGRHGAAHLVDYRSDDFRAAVKTITDGRGADVVFDPVGGDVFDGSLRCIAFEGRLLVVGFASGRIPEVPAGLLLVKNVSVVGLYWGSYASRAPATLAGSLATLIEWHAQGRIAPHVSRTLPLARVGEALGALADRTSTGKVVVTMR